MWRWGAIWSQSSRVYQKQNWVEKARNASLPIISSLHAFFRPVHRLTDSIFVGRVRGRFYSFLQVVIPTNFGEMQETSYRFTLIKREILSCLRIDPYRIQTQNLRRAGMQRENNCFNHYNTRGSTWLTRGRCEHVVFCNIPAEKLVVSHTSCKRHEKKPNQTS